MIGKNRYGINNLPPDLETILRLAAVFSDAGKPVGKKDVRKNLQNLWGDMAQNRRMIHNVKVTDGL